jgi:hypothetical protein
MWKQWVNALLGAATVLVAFFGLTDASLTWTFALMGLVVLALSLWTAREVSSDEYERVAHAHHRHA